MKQVEWTEGVVGEFIRYANLSDEEAEIIRMRAKGKSIVQIALALNTSTSTISRRVSLLKKKYSYCQRNGANLPPRKERSNDVWA